MWFKVSLEFNEFHEPCPAVNEHPLRSGAENLTDWKELQLATRWKALLAPVDLDFQEPRQEIHQVSLYIFVPHGLGTRLDYCTVLYRQQSAILALVNVVARPRQCSRPRQFNCPRQCSSPRQFSSPLVAPESILVAPESTLVAPVSTLVPSGCTRIDYGATRVESGATRGDSGVTRLWCDQGRLWCHQSRVPDPLGRTLPFRYLRIPRRFIVSDSDSDS